MIKITNNEGVVKMPVAGINDKGVKFQGETTNEIINDMFGDLVSGETITAVEYQEIINRCESNQWLAWKESWETWKSEDILD